MSSYRVNRNMVVAGPYLETTCSSTWFILHKLVDGNLCHLVADENILISCLYVNCNICKKQDHRGNREIENTNREITDLGCKHC